MGATYSEGSRTGRIVKFSKSGLIWKTYEGEMICDGMKTKTLDGGQTTAIANTWHFSLDSKSTKGEDIEKLAEQIEKKMSDNQPVRVTYWNPIIGFPCQGNTKNYATNIN